jgi:hypothetical protein
VDKFFKTFSVAGVILLIVLLGGLILHRVYALRKHGHSDTTPPSGAAAQPMAGQNGEQSGASDSAAPEPAAQSPAPGRPRAETGRNGGRQGGAHRAGRPPVP